jgi:uncharacterized MAPEG superfamily protein
MAYTSELQSLTLISIATVLMWAPYVLMRFVKWGLWKPFANPDPLLPALPAWAERAKEAHRNGVENLVTFAAVVLVAGLVGIHTPMTILAAKVYVAARLIHYVVYTIGIPVARTLAFLTGVGATLVIALAVLQA